MCVCILLIHIVHRVICKPNWSKASAHQSLVYRVYKVLSVSPSLSRSLALSLSRSLSLSLARSLARCLALSRALSVTHTHKSHDIQATNLNNARNSKITAPSSDVSPPFPQSRKSFERCVYVHTHAHTHKSN